MFPLRFFSYLKKNFSYIYLNIFKNNNFNFSINPKLKKIFYKLNPDLIIFPMQDSHLLAYEILKLSNKNTLALIDNWDNLSSRGTHDILNLTIFQFGENKQKIMR